VGLWVLLLQFPSLLLMYNPAALFSYCIPYEFVLHLAYIPLDSVVRSLLNLVLLMVFLSSALVRWDTIFLVAW